MNFKSSTVALLEDFANEVSHTVLQVEGSVCDAPLRELTLAIGPQSLDGVELRRVGAVEHETDIVALGRFCHKFCMVNRQVVDEHDARAASVVVVELGEELYKRVLVDSAVLYVLGDDLTLRIDGCCDCNGFKGLLFFGIKTGCFCGENQTFGLNCPEEKTASS